MILLLSEVSVYTNVRIETALIGIRWNAGAWPPSRLGPGLPRWRLLGVRCTVCMLLPTICMWSYSHYQRHLDCIANPSSHRLEKLSLGTLPQLVSSGNGLVVCKIIASIRQVIFLFWERYPIVHWDDWSFRTHTRTLVSILVHASPGNGGPNFI